MEGDEQDSQDDVGVGSDRSMLRSKISELSDTEISFFLREVVLKGGHFHAGSEESDVSVDDDDIAAFRQFRKKSELKPFSDRDEDCAIITLRSSLDVWSRPRLGRQCRQAIMKHGRISIAHLADLLDVHAHHIHRISHTLYSEEATSSIHRIDDDFVSAAYLDRVSDQILDEAQSSGRVLLSDMARDVFQLPLHAVVHSIGRRLSQQTLAPKIKLLSFDGKLITPSLQVDEETMGGVREILTEAYCEARFQELRQQLSCVQVPTKLDDATSSFPWDGSLTVEKVREMCASGTLTGEVRLSSSTSSEGATKVSSLSSPTYVPRTFLVKQRKDMEELYLSNGYVTFLQCASLGIPSGRTEEYVKDSFPEALCLSTALLDSQKCIPPLEVAILEAKSTQSFSDLGPHLPDFLLSAESDLNVLLDRVLQTMTSIEPRSKEEVLESVGLTIACDGEALFFSWEMIKEIRSRILEPLIVEFGKTRAAELQRMEEEQPASPPRPKRQESGPKKQAKNKKLSAEESRQGSDVASAGKNSRSGADAGSSCHDFLPLRAVAEAISLEYPALHDIQERCQSLADAPDPQWESLNTSNDDSQHLVHGPLLEFCRQALYDNDFRKKYLAAVKAEHERIRLTSKRGASSMSLRGATETRSIETAFEDVECFATACHFLQVLAKSVKSLVSLDHENTYRNILERDFLAGCGAHFARRITEYCLFKHDLEPGMFSFVPEGCSQDDQSNPFQFYHPVRLALKSFDPTYLSCSLSDTGDERHPLKVLEENLPTEIGAGLAALWSQLGKECYQRGQAEGDFDGFLEQARESCLNICGLPFKVLDKKAEKQLLSKRKQALLADLEVALDPTEVLDLTLILLFQQVKSICVAGELVRGPVLNLLLKEKKIPQHVKDALRNMADALNEQDRAASGDLVATVKAFGLSKDISKTPSRE